MDFQEPFDVCEDELKYPNKIDLHHSKNKEHNNILVSRASRFESRPKDNGGILSPYKQNIQHKNYSENTPKVTNKKK